MNLLLVSAVIILVLAVYYFTTKNEVYALSGGYMYDKNNALQACQVLGGKLATEAQMEQAQAAKADWCSTGFTSDGVTPSYPTNTRLYPGCGNGTPGLAHYGNDGVHASVNCYGLKPLLRNRDKVLAFNETQYSAHSSLNFIDKAINKVKSIF